MGRHTEFSQEIVDIVCERIADGESLRSICGDVTLPSKATIFKWLSQNKDFADQYAHARDAQADAMADDILHISNTPCIGVKTTTKSTGIETIEGDMIEHRRLQVDARKWLAARMAPKKYGDRIDLNAKILDITNLSDEELDKKLSELE